MKPKVGELLGVLLWTLNKAARIGRPALPMVPKSRKTSGFGPRPESSKDF